MKENRFDKTVVIPTKVVKGHWEYFFGGPLPELREGTIFDLLVPEEGIKNPAFLKILESSDCKELLPKGVTLYAAVSSAQVPDNLQEFALSPASLFQGGVNLVTRSYFTDAVFVKIVTEEPLCLILRGTKLGRLQSVKCNIPALKLKTPALSLNHAYRLISEAFEPQRISHAGNVFQKMLYIDSEKRCFSLDDLRDRFEASNEHTLLQPTDPDIEGDEPHY